MYIKRVQTGDQESQIAQSLSTPPLLKDPRNHCVSIQEVLQDDEDENVSYLVMPFLKTMDEPEFQSPGEVIDFADQLLEVCPLYLRMLVRRSLLCRVSYSCMNKVSPTGLYFLPAHASD